MSFKLHLVFAVLATLSFSSATIVQYCPGSLQPIHVRVEGCEVEPCDLLTGTSAILDITFLVPKNSNSLVPKVRATTGPITINYTLPLELQNACNSITNGYCPLEENEILVYHLEMPIVNFPKIPVKLEFSLLGDNLEVFQCFKIDCKVV